MPRRPLQFCSRPGCSNRVERGQCDEHRRQDQRTRDRARPNASARGYASAGWRRNRAKFLAAHPTCVDCGAPATVPDHDPVSRAELVARGDPHPDAWHHLKPRCRPCHARREGFGRGR